MAKELRESREVSTVSRGVVNRKALKMQELHSGAFTLFARQLRGASNQVRRHNHLSLSNTLLPGKLGKPVSAPRMHRLQEAQSDACGDAQPSDCTHHQVEIPIVDSAA
jgi:hypothetical protein